MEVEIIIPNQNESYKDYIQRILDTRENKKDENNYQERHHIVPKCMGGKNDEDNLIYLYGQEHYYAHKLLAIENPLEEKLQCAWWNLCHCKGSSKKRTYIVSADEYNEAKKRHSETLKGENNPNYGGMSEQAKAKMSLNHCDVKGGKNPRSKAVMCIETNEKFPCAADAGRHYHLSKSNPGSEIRKSCKIGCSAGYNDIIKKKFTLGINLMSICIIHIK